MKLLCKSLWAQGHKNFESLGIDFHNNNKPEKILQVGEGNFLRAFADAFIDELNEKNLFNGSVVIVPPIAQTTATVDVMNAQDCCYTVVLRGLEKDVPVVRGRIVTCVSRALNMYTDFKLYMGTMMNPDLRFIVSNTTEAGIVFLETDKPQDIPTEPPVSFPAKITALLYERYKLFNGAADKGFIFIPCELIDNNGLQLKEFVLRHANNWELPRKFIDWVKNCNHFTNTLVDRIVTGYPKDEIEKFENELGYRDNLLVTGELFHFFAIEAESEVAKEINETLPFNKAGLHVVLTSDATPYKLRKVRILNGAHTMSVLAAFLSGKDTVGEMMNDALFVKFIRKGIYDEILPSLLLPPVEHEGLIEKDLLSFADSVFDRFANPYIKHYLLSIALNSVSKFKARVLPSILEYYKKTGKFPKALTLSFAALLAFYKGTEREYEISDSMDVLEFFAARGQKNDIAQFVEETLSNESFWGADLTALPGFCEAVALYLRGILSNGVKHEIEKIIGEKL
jgi:tagaturonate reductase